MIRWILNRLRSNRDARPKMTPRERGIFEFFDGAKVRQVDAWRIWRMIFSHPTVDFWELLEINQALATIPVRDDEQAKRYFDNEAELDAFIREILELRKIEDGDGVTDEEAQAIMHDFLAFIEELKKKQDALPTGLRPTDSSPANGHSHPQRNLDFTSTVPASKNGEQPTQSRPSKQP